MLGMWLWVQGELKRRREEAKLLTADDKAGAAARLSSQAAADRQRALLALMAAQRALPGALTVLSRMLCGTSGSGTCYAP